MVFFVAAAVFLYHPAGGRLILSDDKTGREFLQVPLDRDEEFSITFVHSVNNTPVTDVYGVSEAGKIYLKRTVYYDFGAGVPFDLNEGESLSYTEDGAIVISGIDREISGFVLFVGTVSDHTLSIGGRSLSLRELCGRNTRLRIRCRIP